VAASARAVRHSPEIQFALCSRISPTDVAFEASAASGGVSPLALALTVSVRQIHPSIRPPKATAWEGDDVESGGRWDRTYVPAYCPLAGRVPATLKVEPLRCDVLVAKVTQDWQELVRTTTTRVSAFSASRITGGRSANQYHWEETVSEED